MDVLDDPKTTAELLTTIQKVQDLMVRVATGVDRIQYVNDDYRRLYEIAHRALLRAGFEEPNPYADLWDFYSKWSSGDLPTYRSRREYLRDLFRPLEERLRGEASGSAPNPSLEPTGWVRVDRTLGEVRPRLEKSETEEHFQAVGLLCRESIITLAQMVYDPAKHPTEDGVAPSKTDAKRMLDAYLSVALAGTTNKIARRYAKAALDLANELQHLRTATFRDAALCSSATSSLVNIIAIVSGRRDPDSA